MALPDSPRQDRPAVYVTVHGTWAAKAAWAQPESALSVALVEQARQQGRQAIVQPFTWSGRNSIAARRQAGRALAQHLVQLRSRDRASAVYVVAHSHGGSVLAYAVRHEPRLANDIDGFVALATPWLRVTPCAYAHALRSLLVNWAIFATYWIALIALPAPVSWVVERSLPTRAQPADSWIGLGVALGDFATYALWYVVVAAVGGVIAYLLGRRLARHFARTRSEFEQRIQDAADQASTLGWPVPPGVFFKPVGDEAALTLSWTSAMAAAMQAASQLSFVLLRSVRDVWSTRRPIVRRVAGVVSAVAWFVGTGLVAVHLFVFGHGLLEAIGVELHALQLPGDLEDVAGLLFWELPFFFALLTWAATLLAIAAVGALTLVAVLAALAAGLPAVTGGLFFSVAVEATPAGRHELVLVDVSTPQRQQVPAHGRLSHSALYESPGVIAAVANALDRLERAGAAEG